MTTNEAQQVPAHINDVTGRFCTRAGLVTPGGRCPDGCDHADHYANDGHLECAETWAVIGCDDDVTLEWLGTPDEMPDWLAAAAESEAGMDWVYMLVTADEAAEVGAL